VERLLQLASMASDRQQWSLSTTWERPRHAGCCTCQDRTGAEPWWTPQSGGQAAPAAGPRQGLLALKLVRSERGPLPGSAGSRWPAGALVRGPGVVLRSGGGGHLFEKPPNPARPPARGGDGLASGAQVRDLEFVQVSTDRLDLAGAPHFLDL